MSEEDFILPLFVKDIFTKKIILGWRCFSFVSLKMSLHCCLAYTVFTEESAVILTFIFSGCFFFFPPLWLLLTFFSIYSFMQFEYNVPWYQFSSCFLCLELLEILGFMGLLLSLHLEGFFSVIFFFCYFFYPSHFLPPSDTPITHIIGPALHWCFVH